MDRPRARGGGGSSSRAGTARLAAAGAAETLGQRGSYWPVAMRVAFVVTYFPKLSEAFILNQALELEKRGHSVAFYSLRRGESMMQPGARPFLDRGRVRDAGMPGSLWTRALRVPRMLWAAPERVVALDMLRDGLEAASFRNLYRLASVDDDLDVFDIVHAQFGDVARQCAFLARTGRLRAPLVSSFRGNDMTGYLRYARPGVFADVFRFSRACLPVSSRWIPRLVALGANAARIHPLPSGIPCDRFARATPGLDGFDRPILVSVARLLPHKGIDLGLRVFARIHRRFPLARYAIFGDGPQKRSLHGLARRLGLMGAVDFRGACTNHEIARALKLAHLHLFTTVTGADGRTEGVSNALKESQAAGIPAVAFRHPGVAEVVDEGVTGVLVEEGAVEAMADEACALLSDRTLAERMGAEAAIRARERFDIEKITDRLETIYSEVLTSERRARHPVANPDET